MLTLKDIRKIAQFTREHLNKRIGFIRNSTTEVVEIFHMETGRKKQIKSKTCPELNRSQPISEKSLYSR